MTITTTFLSNHFPELFKMVEERCAELKIELVEYKSRVRGMYKGRIAFRIFNYDDVTYIAHTYSKKLPTGYRLLVKTRKEFLNDNAEEIMRIIEDSVACIDGNALSLSNVQVLNSVYGMGLKLFRKHSDKDRINRMKNRTIDLNLLSPKAREILCEKKIFTTEDFFSCSLDDINAWFEDNLLDEKKLFKVINQTVRGIRCFDASLDYSVVSKEYKEAFLAILLGESGEVCYSEDRADEYVCARDELLGVVEEISNSVKSREVLLAKEIFFDENADFSLIAERIACSRTTVCNYVKHGIRQISVMITHAFPSGRAFLEKYFSDGERYISPEDALSFLYYGFNGSEQRKYVCYLLFGEEASNVATRLTYRSQRKARERIQEETERKRAIKTDEERNRILSKITMPEGDFYTVPSNVARMEHVARVEHVYARKHIERVQDKIGRLFPEVEIIERPNIVYFSERGLSYTPDLAIKFPDGRCVLVNVVPSLNLCFHYNQERFRMLEIFAKEHGLGFLICDGSFNTWQELKEQEVDERLVAELDSVLRSKGSIHWSDVLKLKERMIFTGKDVAAYVIKNGYRMNRRSCTIYPSKS